MPPKKKKSPGSPKAGKGKLTKAEKDKLKKEEELQRQKEEEEARRIAAEEEKERLEREKAEAEKKERLLLEERRRKAGQIKELEELWENNRRTLREEQAEARRNAKWARYMRCDGSPDPTIAAEINTYMNLWRENTKENDIDTILKESNLVLSLIKELNYILDTTPAEETSEKETIRYKQTSLELTSLLQEKLDLASHDLLLHASELADPETSNLQYVINNDVITLCMWGNLSKNPRIRSFEFEETGFLFDIPKPLALSDCAYRILFTKYDHLSPQCESFKPRRKEKPDPAMVEEEKVAEEGEGEEGQEAGGEAAEGAIGGAEINRETTEMSAWVTRELMATLREPEKKEDKKEEDEDEKEETEQQAPDWDIKTPEPEEWQDFDGDDDVVDLRAYVVLGGVFHFNLLHLPPQPKVVKDWTITQVIEPAQLAHLEYIADDAGMSAPSSAKESTREDAGNAAAKKEDRPPIGVTLKLPDTVYFSEEPQVVIWDPIRKLWSLDGFSDHDFREENRQITFKTVRFGTFALIQDSHINMPFQSWEIRPHGPNSALFTIIAAIVEVELEIKEGLCMLNVPDGKAELQHFKNKWMTPHQMIDMLRGSGINVFPSPDSNRYVSIQNKHPVTEERVYQQMALTASSMAYSWSKWNSEIKNREQIIVQGTEHLEDEPLLEEDWSLFMVTKYRTIKLQMTEFDEEFSEEHAEGTEYHADLYHMAMELATDDGKERMRTTSNQFIDAVYTLLKATRIITYS